MPKLFYANGINGTVAIAEPGVDVNNPLGNLQSFYFHSALDYLYVNQIVTGTLSLPQRDANGSDASRAYGSTIYTIAYHGLGYRPMVFGFWTSNGQPIVGDSFIDAGGLASIRTLNVGADNNYIYARELFLNKDVTFGAKSLQYKLFIFNNAGL